MEVDVSDGRLYLPKRIREKFGNRYELVDRGDRLVLIPVDEDPLGALRDEFSDVDSSVEDMRKTAREEALEGAGR